MTVSGYMLDKRGGGSLVAILVEDPEETAMPFFGKHAILK